MDITTFRTIGAGILAIIPTGFLLWTDDMALSAFVFLMAVILDSITGIIKAFWCGTFETSIAWEKITKKLVKVIIALCGCYLIEVIGATDSFPFCVLSGSFGLVIFSLAILEILSVFENLDDMGLKVPTNFIKYIRRNVLKEKCKHKNKKK